MRKLTIILITVAAMLAVMSVVGAQDATATPLPPLSSVGMVAPIRTVFEVVADETGLEQREIMSQVAEGMTLADIIQTNNGDVQSVIDQSVSKLTAEINQTVADGKMPQDRADKLLANLKDLIRKGINGELFPNKLDRGAVNRASERILIQSVADATKLRPVEILKQLREGKTLAEVITANGGNVERVVSAAIVKATDDINTAVNDGRLGQAQADELIAHLQESYIAGVNGEFRGRAEKAIVGLAVLRLAAEQTGLTMQDIVKKIRSGKSLADVLTAHNVDTTAFITSAVNAAKKRLDQAVTKGRMTQLVADQKLEQFQQRLTERINQVGGVEATLEATAAA